MLVPERFAQEYAARRAEFSGCTEAATSGRCRRSYLPVAKDGSEFPVEVGLNPIQTPHGTFGFGDGSRYFSRASLPKKRRAASREQIDLLTRLSLLGEMTASLAHELNQPLSAIMSNANAAMQYIANREA